jgi:hypothetical protein
VQRAYATLHVESIQATLDFFAMPRACIGNRRISEVEPSTPGARELNHATMHNLSMRTNCKEIIIITQGRIMRHAVIMLTKPDIIWVVTAGLGVPCTITIEETVTAFGDLSTR